MQKVFLYIFFLSSTLLYSQESDDTAKFAFLRAAYEGDSSSVSIYLNDTSLLNTTDAYNTNALMFATSGGYLSICKMLVDAGIDINAIDYLDRTALFIAIYDGHFEIADFLAWSGANTEIPDYFGRTPLHIAVAFNEYLLADMLLFYGANPEAASIDSNTPLHFAAFYGASNLADLLINKGVDINSKNNRGFTPLMLAAQNNKNLGFGILYRNINDLIIRNNQGFSVCDILAENNNTEVLETLPLLQEINGGKRIADSLIMAALIRNQYQTFDLLKKMGVNPEKRLLFSSSYLAVPQKISKDDYFTGIEGGVNEHRYRYSLFTGLMFRPYRKRLFITEDEKRIQVGETRRYAYTGLRKRWPLKTTKNNCLISFDTGLKYAYTSYRHKGFSKRGSSGFAALEAGISFNKRQFATNILYEYSNWKADKTSPHTIVISVQLPLHTYKTYNRWNFKW